MSAPQSSTIYVADLPVNKKEIPPAPGVSEGFLRQLFEGYGVSNEEDAVTIKVKTGRNGNPEAFAFIKFDTHEQALKAIEELNYTKLDGIPIRLIIADKETMDIMHSGQGNLFIKNLPPGIEVSQLHELFSNYGDVISCKIPFDLVEKDGEKECVLRSYGYVQFRNPEDANQVLEDFKGATFGGRPIEIQPHCPPQRQDPEQTFQNCYIKYLPKHFNDADLKQLFEEYGTPVSCKIMVDESGESLQFGFCSMSSHEEAVRAVEALNGKEIEGNVIECNRAMNKQERSMEIEKQTEEWRRANIEKYKGRNIYVKNFDENVTDEELKDAFSIFGEVESCKVMRDEKGNSKKFGFVCYKTAEQADECVQNSECIRLHDKQPFVSLAMSKEQRMKISIQKQHQKREAQTHMYHQNFNLPQHAYQYQFRQFPPK